MSAVVYQCMSLLHSDCALILMDNVHCGFVYTFCRSTGRLLGYILFNQSYMAFFSLPVNSDIAEICLFLHIV